MNICSETLETVKTVRLNYKFALTELTILTV